MAQAVSRGLLNTEACPDGGQSGTVRGFAVLHLLSPDSIILPLLHLLLYLHTCLVWTSGRSSAVGLLFRQRSRPITD